jgi:hypothetical protein
LTIKGKDISYFLFLVSSRKPTKKILISSLASKTTYK